VSSTPVKLWLLLLFLIYSNDLPLLCNEKDPSCVHQSTESRYTGSNIWIHSKVRPPALINHKLMKRIQKYSPLVSWWHTSGDLRWFQFKQKTYETWISVWRYLAHGSHIRSTNQPCDIFLYADDSKIYTLIQTEDDQQKLQSVTDLGLVFTIGPPFFRI